LASAARHGWDQRDMAGMKPIAKRWPDNVEVFHIADLPVDTLDQGMMRLLRKIADEKGWTVEEVIVAAIEQRVERNKAEKKLDGKIIRFPKLNAHLRSPTV
jgi:hypothetical protein